MVIKSVSISKEVLAERYATLKVQLDKIKGEIEDVSERLLAEMKAGDKIETPEYKVLCSPGRSTTFWTESGKEKKKAFEEELIKQGLMDVKVGSPYIQVRFSKGGVDE